MDTDGASTGEHQERAGEIVLSHITAGENADSTTNSKRKRKPTLRPRINHIPNISNADKERILKMQRNSNQQDAHATASSKTTPPTRIANTDGGLFVDSDEEDPESEWKEVNNAGDLRQKIDEEWDFLGENEADGTAMGPKHAASGLKGKPKRKSQAEMNALQPRLSKDTPCNKTDEELRAIAKLPRGRARHDAAPYAFDVRGRVYSEYALIVLAKGETVLTEEELKKLMDNVPKKLRAIQQPDIFNSKGEVRQRKRKNYLD